MRSFIDAGAIDATKIDEYRPPWATHVRGTIYPPDDGGSRVIEMHCEHVGCNGYFRVTCNSGRVKQHIANFAQSHLHRDALTKPTKNPLEER